MVVVSSRCFLLRGFQLTRVFSVKDGFCSFLLTCFDFDIAGSVNPKQKIS